MSTGLNQNFSKNHAFLRNNSDSSLSSAGIVQNIRKPRGINSKKSIFNLKHPTSHKAVVLDNQELFQKIQHDVFDIFQQEMGKISSFEKRYFLHDLLPEHDLQKIEHDVKELLNSTPDLIPQKKNRCDIKNILNFFKEKKDKFVFLDDSFTIQMGTTGSTILHKDNGSVKRFQDKHERFFDYTVVVPLFDYDLSGNDQHNFTPESTQILPMEYKSLVPEYNKKNSDFMISQNSVFYNHLTPDKKKEIEKLLVSEKLTQGTAIILHTATKAGSDDDGQSVIHASPKVADGFARCFIIARANKYNTSK